VLHANPQALLEHVACAKDCVVVHAVPHPPQLLALVVGSTQVPLHRSGAALPHDAAHCAGLTDVSQTGVAPVHV
jgi:hypothetical protein